VGVKERGKKQIVAELPPVTRSISKKEREGNLKV
jgi:hypothetical protein